METWLLVEPAGQAYPPWHGPEQDAVVAPEEPQVPALHKPVHAADVRPDTFPYLPPGQLAHALAPDKLYCPAGHKTAVELVDPSGQAYPAEQLPEQPAVTSPVVAPYKPAGHGEHPLEPARLYCPAPHTLAVGLVLPAGHAYPAVHGPVQALRDWPATSPYRPPRHSPLQLAAPRADVLPKVPAGHAVHTLAPEVLY